ncbi:MAG: SDR family oxidoreductase [Elusimicrobia bacterium]|nr:SDR family oxidoreductase [Elusimicrobiota bacterium]
MRLQGKVALVTGAARRVGRSIAMALAQRGAKIAIHYHHSRNEAQRLADEVRDSFGREAFLFKADLADVRDVQKMAQAVVKQFKTVHVLVNNASVYEKTPFGDVAAADWDANLNVNLRAPFFLSQEIGAVMKENGEGKIVNIADWAGKRPYADYIPYCVSKAGLLALNAALAKALAPEVQVNAVLPGPVLLPESFSPKARQAVINATLVKRLGSPEDVAQAVLFLLEGSDFITGAEINVDGGRMIA